MIVSCDPDGIKIAASIIKKGGLVVFPTDTVYGLGCDPRNSNAVQSVFKIKKRQDSKHLPVLGLSKHEISKIAVIDNISNKIVDKFWPGPVTLVLKLKDGKIKKTLNLDNKIAVRVPNHPCALALLRECKIIVGTSANFSNSPAFSDSKKVLENFSGFDVLLDGGIIQNAVESTVIEVTDENLQILRQGKITRTEIIASI